MSPELRLFRPSFLLRWKENLPLYIRGPFAVHLCHVASPQAGQPPTIPV